MEQKKMRINDVKLRELLYLRCTNQTERAKDTGVTRYTINAICNGKSCSRSTAEKIAATLNVEVTELQK